VVNPPVTLLPDGLFAGSSNQPLEDSVEVCLFFGADSITAHLSMRDLFEVERIDELVNREFAWQIRLVAKYEERDAFEGWLL
jgi:hypothetical protein